MVVNMSLKLFKKKKNNNGVKTDKLESRKVELQNLLKEYELENVSNKDKVDLMVRIKQINTLLDKVNMPKKRGS